MAEMKPISNPLQPTAGFGEKTGAGDDEGKGADRRDEHARQKMGLLIVPGARRKGDARDDDRDHDALAQDLDAQVCPALPGLEAHQRDDQHAEEEKQGDRPRSGRPL